MEGDIHDRVAAGLLAMMPLYHRYILRTTSKVSGIQIAQYRALGMLMKYGSLPMSELCGLLFISKPYMTVLADSLVENGWAERRKDPEDRRVIIMAITQKGKKHLRAGFNLYHADVKNLISRLGTEDLRAMSAALEELQRIFSKLED